MVQYVELCKICSSNLQKPLEQWIVRPHHVTFQGLQEAVAESCFICSALWSIDKYYQGAWATGSTPFRKIRFRVFTPDNGVKWAAVRLQVFYPTNSVSKSGEAVSFCLLPSDDEDVADKFLPSELEGSTSSSLTLGLIHEWFLSCQANHPRCRRLADRRPWSPTRLVDIGAEGKVEWKLHFPAESGGPRPSYMTLSYRWSDHPRLMLLTTNFEQFRRGILIKDLPQTFQDSVRVAQRFSVRYLWIDALCIIQDSNEDWERESANMRHVYANSLCNIAASASSDPEGGLFRLRDPRTVRPGLVSAGFGTTEQKDYYIFEEKHLESRISEGSLHHRGWVFQERLLAPRVLHFANDQVLWECFTEHRCEGFPQGIPFQRPLKYFEGLWPGEEPEQPPPQEMSFKACILWMGLVKGYSQSAFTKPSDKLVAFSGMARLVHEATGDEYIAGLWRSRLAMHLGWRVHKPVARLSSEYRAPSWSWACLDGPVQYLGISDDSKIHVSILDAQVQLSGPDPFGSVSGGHLLLEGLVIPVTCRGREDNGSYELEIGPGRVKVEVFPDVLGTGFEDGAGVGCLVLGTQKAYSYSGQRETRKTSLVLTLYMLVLEPLQSAPNTFKRIGHFDLRETEEIEMFGIRILEGGSVELLGDRQRTVITIV